MSPPCTIVIPTSTPPLSHAERLRLAENGAQVVHAEAARLALAHQVPLHIYSYRAPFGGRTGTAVSSAP